MKIISEKPSKSGGKRLIIELSSNEGIVSIQNDAFYKLGGQVEDIVQSHVISEMEFVYWCSISQKWV